MHLTQVEAHPTRVATSGHHDVITSVLRHADGVGLVQSACLYLLIVALWGLILYVAVTSTYP